MKHFIFNIFLIFIFSGCEIPHSNVDGDIALCNIHNKDRNEIVLCPQLGDIDISVGQIPLNKLFLVRFLNTEPREAIEFLASSFQNPILNIHGFATTDNNISHISFTPKIIGTTVLMIGDINLTLTVVDNFSL